MNLIFQNIGVLALQMSGYSGSLLAFINVAYQTTVSNSFVYFVVLIKMILSREFKLTEITFKILHSKMKLEMALITTFVFISVGTIPTRIQLVIMNTHVCMQFRHKGKTCITIRLQTFVNVDCISRHCVHFSM